MLTLVAAALVAAAPGVAPAQESPDDQAVAAAYHRLAGTKPDIAALAEQSPVVRRASGFDRADVLRAETERLQQVLSAADPAREFTLRVGDRVSEYDHDRAEFSIELFQPGFFVPIEAFGQQYQLVFANAEPSRAIPMPREEARAFDLRLQAMSRAVTNEIRYRVVGTGDPAGGVTGPRVIRAELLSSRLLDRNGGVIRTVKVVPLSVTATASAVKFDPATADIAGFRVGVKADELESTLGRLFGTVTRRPSDAKRYPGITTVMTVNDMGCASFPGRRSGGEPGAVCVTALVDDDDVVRSLRIERVFPWMEGEVFRRTLVARYGPVATAEGAGALVLGWGPVLGDAARYVSGSPNALTARYEQDDDYVRRGGNALPRIRVVLQLLDVRWAETQSH